MLNFYRLPRLKQKYIIDTIKNVCSNPLSSYDSTSALNSHSVNFFNRHSSRSPAPENQSFVYHAWADQYVQVRTRSVQWTASSAYLFARLVSKTTECTDSSYSSHRRCVFPFFCSPGASSPFPADRPQCFPFRSIC